MSFKTNDFVNTKDNKVHKVVFDSMALLSDPPQYVTQCNDGVFLTKDLELWKQKVGEYCWFWNEGNTDYAFKEFSHRIECTNYITKDGEGYSFCEPFIGELPSFIKEMKI